MRVAKKFYPSARLKKIYFWLNDKPVLKSLLLRVYAYCYSWAVKKRIRGKSNVITHDRAVLRNVTFRINGNGNRIVIGNACFMQNVTISIRGSNNEIRIDDEVRFNFSASLCCENSKCNIRIGRKCTFETVHMAAIEGRSIIIGSDCMISGPVDIRTGDSHSILDARTKERINTSEDVMIGDHVWVGSGVRILKGVKIHNNSVLGMGSLVTKDVPEGSIAAGVPARIVRTGVTWDRMRL